MKLLTAGLCVFFLAFATLRAVRVPLTYDEAASSIRYIDTSTPSVFDTSALSIFNFEVATNHFLNTLLTKACDVVAGGSEIVLRLPSIIGYAMFLGFSLLILHRSVRPAIATPGFLLLNLNPYVLDFFSLSRGYGLSLGFLMGSLFYLFKFLDHPQQGDRAPRDVSRSLACALGAVMSNFAMLNVWLSLLIVLLAAIVLRNVVFGESSDQRIPDPGSLLSCQQETGVRSLPCSGWPRSSPPSCFLKIRGCRTRCMNRFASESQALILVNANGHQWCGLTFVAGTCGSRKMPTRMNGGGQTGFRIAVSESNCRSRTPAASNISTS